MFSQASVCSQGGALSHNAMGRGVNMQGVNMEGRGEYRGG